MELGLRGIKRVVHTFAGRKRMVVVEGQWVLPGTTNGGRVYGAVRATVVVRFAMGSMVLDQLGRGFGAFACFRLWWTIQLRQYEFASGADVVRRSSEDAR